MLYSNMSSLFHLLCLICLANSEIQNVGWWKHTVFYQIYPRSFMDSNGDGIGDLNGIRSKLEYFVESNIGGIWLSPIYASPMVDFGYDISNFTKVDEVFGTMDDFLNLMKKAKSLGIKVILDFVPNHTSDKHVWFEKSKAGETKYADYYIWKPMNSNGLPPNNWISVFSGSAWQYEKGRNLAYLHQFERRQPDLNYNNKEVRKEMEQVLKFWLDKGVDGFRVDAVPHLFESDLFINEPKTNTPGIDSQDYAYLDHIYTKDDPRSYDLVKSWRKVLDDWSNEHNEDEKVMMTEAYTSLENTIKYYDYGSEVPFNFKFITDLTSYSTPSQFKNVIDTWLEKMPENKTANWVMGNHDQSRTESRYPGRGDQMTMLAMILPGVALTYYGEEIGMVDKTDISWEDTKDPQACNAGKEKYQTRSRDPVRAPFQWNDSLNAGFTTGTPWIPVHSNFHEINLERQKLMRNSHYKVYTELTKLRKVSPALKEGNLTTTVLNETVLLVLREHEEETISLLINFSEEEDISVNLTSEIRDTKGRETVLVVAGSNLLTANWGEAYNLSNVTIPARSSLLLSSKVTSDNTGGGAGSYSPWKIVLSTCAALAIFFM